MNRYIGGVSKYFDFAGQVLALDEFVIGYADLVELGAITSHVFSLAEDPLPTNAFLMGCSIVLWPPFNGPGADTLSVVVLPYSDAMGDEVILGTYFDITTYPLLEPGRFSSAVSGMWLGDAIPVLRINDTGDGHDFTGWTAGSAKVRLFYTLVP